MFSKMIFLMFLKNEIQKSQETFKPKKVQDSQKLLIWNFWERIFFYLGQAIQELRIFVYVKSNSSY